MGPTTLDQGGYRTTVYQSHRSPNSVGKKGDKRDYKHTYLKEFILVVVEEGYDLTAKRGFPSMYSVAYDVAKLREAISRG